MGPGKKACGRPLLDRSSGSSRDALVGGLGGEHGGAARTGSRRREGSQEGTWRWALVAIVHDVADVVKNGGNFDVRQLNQIGKRKVGVRRAKIVRVVGRSSKHLDSNWNVEIRKNVSNSNWSLV